MGHVQFIISTNHNVENGNDWFEIYPDSLSVAELPTFALHRATYAEQRPHGVGDLAGIETGHVRRGADSTVLTFFLASSKAFIHWQDHYNPEGHSPAAMAEYNLTKNVTGRRLRPSLHMCVLPYSHPVLLQKCENHLA
jgi:hypothetical protein